MTLKAIVIFVKYYYHEICVNRTVVNYDAFYITAATNRGASLDRNSVFSSDSITPSAVPIDKTDRMDVHDFRDQLRSMGACKFNKPMSMINYLNFRLKT